MSHSTCVLLWRDFYDDELVLFAKGDEPGDEDDENSSNDYCVLGTLHLDALLDLFGFQAYTRVAKSTRDGSLLPVELSLRFYDAE
ncbi:MAG: hypothetical protein KY475_19355 [Planctomycetes bacterium]|nr:hypothetical protein [Planctomycetota bacterium]